MNVLLWILQVLLAALFLFAGVMKLIMPPEQMTGPVALPVGFLRFIGVCEVLGALGLVLPWLLRLKPGLTPLAAAGLVIIMIGATVIGIMGGMAGIALMNGVLALLLAFVAYRRWQMVAQRSAAESAAMAR